MNTYLILAGLGTYLLGMLSTYVSKIYGIFFLSIRIPPNYVSQIYKYLQANASYQFKFTESFKFDSQLLDIPVIESSLILCNKIPISLDISEKYLTAGQTSKEIVCSITIPRFFKRKLFDLLKTINDSADKSRAWTKVFINTRWTYFSEINHINRVKQLKNDVVLEEYVGKQIDKIVQDFEAKARPKIGLLLYGPPGNGKTSIIRSISAKLDLDIYIPMFLPDMSNSDIVSLFAEIPTTKECIIVLEDFDSLFHRRYPNIQNAKFTFDTFLNILDGLYINLDNKIIIMTANNIDDIDDAIKCRPSRFDYSIKVDNPNYDSRLSILKRASVKDRVEEVAKLTEGYSAAIVSEIAKRNLNDCIIEEEIEKIASTFTTLNTNTIENKPITRLVDKPKPQFIMFPKRRM